MLLMISKMAFAQEWNICKIVSVAFIIIHIKGAGGESSCALWQTALCREVTVAWILLLQGKQPLSVSERTLAVLICFCLSGGLLPQPPMVDFPSCHEPYGKARSALFPAEVVSCVLQLSPGGLGTWPLHRPSCPARKPIVCFSSHCPLSPDL